MSLIGPHLDVWNYPAALSDYRSHYNFRPGIIGWAQLNGHDTINTLEQAQRHLDYNLSYIRNWSLLLEFKILVRTAFGFVPRQKLN
jgi:lipopolysaccharide/colanic/teichoic acid biosynthesis glycosyltransferase